MLDTNACIAIIRRQPEAVLKRLRGKTIGQVGLSSITLAELEFGAAKSERATEARNALAEFLLPLEICPFDLAASASYGQVRAALERAGNPIGPLDTMIAGHALSLSAILVTNNVREFRKVAGLQIDNWAETAGQNL